MTEHGTQFVLLGALVLGCYALRVANERYTDPFLKLPNPLIYCLKPEKHQAQEERVTVMEMPTRLWKRLMDG